MDGWMDGWMGQGAGREQTSGISSHLMLVRFIAGHGPAEDLIVSTWPGSPSSSCIRDKDAVLPRGKWRHGRMALRRVHERLGKASRPWKAPLLVECVMQGRGGVGHLWVSRFKFFGGSIPATIDSRSWLTTARTQGGRTRNGWRYCG
jgi:hypothetical protein